ncbi:MAG: hypothetical protein Q8936_01760 [Bacillota bacterium]|nr:hypothetical protein [Bacillota bacterium]
MKLGDILREQQPNEYNKLNSKVRDKEKDLSFEDFENLMKHDSYKRHRGAIRRR